MIAEAIIFKCIGEATARPICCALIYKTATGDRRALIGGPVSAVRHRQSVIATSPYGALESLLARLTEWLSGNLITISGPVCGKHIVSAAYRSAVNKGYLTQNVQHRRSLAPNLLDDLCILKGFES
jgi:hypothetical protein